MTQNSRPKQYVRRTLIGFAAVVQLLFFPVVTFAETPSTGSVPADTTQPTGADAKTYTFNKETGLWENEYYTWNPATNQTKPKTVPTYSYNPQTGMWDTTEWKYDVPSGAYVTQPVSQPIVPEGAQTVGPAQDTTTSKTNPEQSQAVDNQETAGIYDQFFNAAISNSVQVSSQSGVASVTHNTTGGNAQSGSVVSIANILNMLQSSWGMNPAQIATFMADINGDVIGDLLLNPDTMLNSPLAVGSADTTNMSVTVATSGTGTIQNNIAVESYSGDATISGNTTAGSATSGDATAIANVINLINSSISAGQSFIGNININGNLDGDILLPESVRNQLKAGTPPTTTLDPSSIGNGDSLTSLTNAQGIATTVTLGATSGDTDVSNNTTAGNATSGTAGTGLTVFNMTGSNVFGSNALLVFVNVLGTWVGMIVDTPTGSTTALLGSTDQSNQQTNDVPDTTVETNNQSAIINNISVQASSGDASVTNNTRGGSAASGNTHAGATITNMTNSNLSFADWFGILFINVIGSWNGSFGVDTDAGGKAEGGSSTTAPPVSDVRIFTIQTTEPGTTRITPVNDTSTPSLGSDNTDNQAVLTAATDGNNQPPAKDSTTKPIASKLTLPWFPIVTIIFSLLLLAVERLLSSRRHHHTNMLAAKG